MQKKSPLAIAVYDSHAAAEAAVKALHVAGFDMKKISIVGKDYVTQEHVVGFLNAGDRARIFGKYGALWGGMVGLLFGSAMMFIPVVGHIIILGPLAAAFVSGIEGAAAVGGVSALVGALTALGVPKDSVLRYETALMANKFMLVVDGDAEDTARATDMLKAAGCNAFDEQTEAASSPAARGC